MILPPYVVESLQLLPSSIPSTRVEFKQSFPLHRNNVIRTLEDFALNLLFNPSIVLSKRVRELLTPYKSYLIKLSSKGVPLKDKRALLSRKGYLFVPALLKVVLPIVKRHDVSPHETDTITPL